MRDRITEFCRLLRLNGVRVSTAEVMDAVTAVATTGIADPGRFRAALAATTVKRQEDGKIFDLVFRHYFLRDLAGVTSAPFALEARSEGIPDGQLAELLQKIAERTAGSGAVARMGAGLLVPNPEGLLRANASRIDLANFTSPFQVGYVSYQIGETLGFRGAEAEMLALIDDVANELGISSANLDALRDIVRRNFGHLKQSLRGYVERQIQLRNIDLRHEMAIRSLEDKPFVQLSPREIAELRTEVERMAKILRSRAAVRQRTFRRGRLDFHRTMRHSLATGGTPVELFYRRKPPHRPRLVILCDISDSVKNVSRFMLQLVHAIHELFDRVYSFVFVADLGETTSVFSSSDCERALSQIYAGDVVSVFANSDYGHALQQFADYHMAKITSRTTVIVIGDGRSNYQDPKVSVIREIRRRAKQVLWLNPESPGAWGYGDSAMLQYEPHCDAVMVARDLNSLRRVIDVLAV